MEKNAIGFNQLMIYLSLKPRKGCIYIESTQAYYLRKSMSLSAPAYNA